jgi:hypothetical protein
MSRRRKRRGCECVRALRVRATLYQRVLVWPRASIWEPCLLYQETSPSSSSESELEASKLDAPSPISSSLSP